MARRAPAASSALGNVATCLRACGFGDRFPIPAGETPAATVGEMSRRPAGGTSLHQALRRGKRPRLRSGEGRLRATAPTVRPSTGRVHRGRASRPDEPGGRWARGRRGAQGREPSPIHSIEVGRVVPTSRSRKSLPEVGRSGPLRRGDSKHGVIAHGTHGVHGKWNRGRISRKSQVTQ